MAHLPSKPSRGALRKACVLLKEAFLFSQILKVDCALIPTGLLSSSIMNWHMIISVLTIVVLKIVGMTLFLLYCEYLSNLLSQPHSLLFFDFPLRMQS